MELAKLAGTKTKQSTGMPAETGSGPGSRHKQKELRQCVSLCRRVCLQEEKASDGSLARVLTSLIAIAGHVSLASEGMLIFFLPPNKERLTS